jgi:hypothetical protein
VDEWNVTHVTFNVQWDADRRAFTNGDRAFRLAVDDPAGDALPESPARSGSGRVNLATGVLAPIPDPVTVNADSRGDAARAVSGLASEAGTGVWRVHVSVPESGSMRPANLDEGTAYTVTVILHHYEAAIMRVVDLEPPGGLTRVASAAAHDKWVWSAGGLAVAAAGLTVALAVTRKRGA